MAGTDTRGMAMRLLGLLLGLLVAMPSTATPAAAAPTIGGCQVFPSSSDASRGTEADWNRDVSAAPVHANSAAYIAAIDASSSNHFLHADFGSDPSYGLPYLVVPSDQPPTKIHFTAYGDESDPGPYPIPRSAPVESGSDHHVLAIQRGSCKLFELFDARYNRKRKRWDAASGAVFNLGTGARRPDGWTSADAAGLPILPGVARYDEVHTAGAVEHALRFTVVRTQRAYVHPATHFASSCSPSVCPNLPPMGLRLRLKAGFDTAGFHGDGLAILRGLKRYGMIVADNGGNWFISGETNTRWDDDDLNQLKTVPGSAFEVVDTGESPRSG